jgi:hypothetical protein
MGASRRTLLTLMSVSDTLRRVQASGEFSSSCAVLHNRDRNGQTARRLNQSLGSRTHRQRLKLIADTAGRLDGRILRESWDAATWGTDTTTRICPDISTDNCIQSHVSAYDGTHGCPRTAVRVSRQRQTRPLLQLLSWNGGPGSSLLSPWAPLHQIRTTI